MSQKNFHKKIVIYGGAFSPPHIGHASTIETLMRFFPCDEIWVIPSASNRSDKKISVSGQERKKMLELMIQELFPAPIMPISVCTLEMEKSKPSLTLDTKKELESRWPNYEFHFVVGSDIVRDIKDKWAKGWELFKTANFIVMPKFPFAIPDKTDLPPKSTVLRDDLIIASNISSTMIRRLIAHGRYATPYLTPVVANYVKKHELYK